jgi:hypothetical protein
MPRRPVPAPLWELCVANVGSLEEDLCLRQSGQIALPQIRAAEVQDDIIGSCEQPGGDP